MQVVKENRDTPQAPPAPAGPRIPRREVWIDFPPEYPGFRVKVWLNFPARMLDDLRSGDVDRMRKTLFKVVLEHNGWVDEDGEPYPPPTDEDFWTTIPTEVGVTIIALINIEVTKLPNSLAAANRR